MKKSLLLGTILCVGLGITACSNTHKSKIEEEPKVKKEEKIESEFATHEELEEANEKVLESMRENIKYKFGKVLSIKGTKIEVILVDTPKGYDDSGYNDNLDIDTSKLKESGTTEIVDLVGADSNILPEELKEVKFIRIGTYEPKEVDGNLGMDKGMILSIDRIS